MSVTGLHKRNLWVLPQLADRLRCSEGPFGEAEEEPHWLKLLRARQHHGQVIDCCLAQRWDVIDYRCQILTCSFGVDGEHMPVTA